MNDPRVPDLLLGPVQHLAFVVSDLEVEAKRWNSQFGVGPWLTSEFDLPGTRPSACLATAYAQWGDIQVELIEQRNAVISCFSDWLSDGSTSRLHHICTHTKTFDDDLAQIQRAGGNVELSFGLDPGTEAVPSRFAIVTSPLSAGMFHELTQPGSFVNAQTQAVRNAAKFWDGFQLIRPMPQSISAL